MFFGCAVPPDSKETKLGSSNLEASPSAGKSTRVVLVTSGGVDISEFPGCHLFRHKFSVRVTKLPQGLVSHELTA